MCYIIRLKKMALFSTNVPPLRTLRSRTVEIPKPESAPKRGRLPKMKKNLKVSTSSEEGEGRWRSSKRLRRRISSGDEQAKTAKPRQIESEEEEGVGAKASMRHGYLVKRFQGYAMAVGWQCVEKKEEGRKMSAKVGFFSPRFFDTLPTCVFDTLPTSVFDTLPTCVF